MLFVEKREYYNTFGVMAETNKSMPGTTESTALESGSLLVPKLTMTYGMFRQKMARALSFSYFVYSTAQVLQLTTFFF